MAAHGGLFGPVTHPRRNPHRICRLTPRPSPRTHSGAGRRVPQGIRPLAGLTSHSIADQGRPAPCHRRPHVTLGLAWSTSFDRSPRFLQRFVQSQLSQVTTTSARLHTAGTSSSSTPNATDAQHKNALPAPPDHRMCAGPDIDAAEAHGVPGRHRWGYKRTSGRCRRYRRMRQKAYRTEGRRSTML